jgi:hypothetical protein
MTLSASRGARSMMIYALVPTHKGFFIISLKAGEIT